MLLKRGIRENSGGIEMSKNMIKLRRVTKNLQWGWGCFNSLGEEPQALKNFVVFCKNNLISGLFW